MDVGALARKQTEFVLDLYKAVAKNVPDENAVLSPLSIGLALAMVAAGAKGATLEQMASCLKLPPGDLMHQFCAHLKDVLKADASKTGLELSCANSIWVDDAIRLHPTFQKLLYSSYGAATASVDFRHNAEEARERANKWAEDETHGKIADVLPPNSVTPNTRMILANAVYFKGTWTRPFEEAMTEDCDFFLPEGSPIKVSMMQSMRDQCVVPYPTFKALRLPYHLHDDTRAFSMIVLLPHDRNGLRQMEENLHTQSVVDDFSNLGEDDERPLTKFQLPKFNMSFGMEVKETLASLGMSLVFGPGADLGNMTDSQEPLSVSSVSQKALVEVNEQGTVAAAVTTVGVTMICERVTEYSTEEDFVADHSFMFLIKEESTSTIIFTGRVTDPSKEQ